MCPPHRDNIPWLTLRFPKENAAVTGAPTVERSTAPLSPLTSRASEIIQKAALRVGACWECCVCPSYKEC